MANVKHDIEISKAFSDAIDRTKKILFDPFDIAKWFIIGFCAWLAIFGNGGGQNILHRLDKLLSINEDYTSYNPTNEYNQGLEEYTSQLSTNFIPTITISVIVVILILAIAVTIVWLRARGAFMFLDCVATNNAEVSRPWKKFKHNANSLFFFNLILALIQIIITIVFLVIPASLLFMNKENTSDINFFLSLRGLILLGLISTLPVLIITIFTTDFVVPIMYMNNYSIMGGWKYFLALLNFNKADFLIYLIFKALIYLAILILFIISCCFSCCILFVLSLIPFIGTVILLPVFVFWRSFSICYLAQYGEQLNCIQKPSEPVSQQGKPEIEAPIQTIEETPEQPQFDDISEIAKEDDIENEDIKPEDKNENKEGPQQ